MSERIAARVAVAVVAGALFVAGCCDIPTATDTGLPECTGPVTVTVDSGSTPVFRWTPDCLIGKLIVIQGGPEQEYWATETRGLNIYASPIVYGVHPPGSVEVQVPQPLTPGDTITVQLFRWISAHPDSLDTGFRLVGEADFVP